MGTFSRSGRPGRGFTATPTLVQWMATLRCPLSCDHCLAWTGEAGFEDMPLDAALGLVDQVAAMDSGVEFLVTGGEPLVRKDLEPVLARLSERGVGWSLNTAAMPSPALQSALKRFPPQFVAVSLDGPREVHDGFRGRQGAFEDSLRSIRFFKSLPGCTVVAGTTVTTRNVARLSETLPIVARSGADSWGIHLLVPEGRAAAKEDLFLSRKQLEGLLRFVARTRTHFPVSMADEFGYCGDWEPLVRDVPFRCGAGTAQCVVLPDGSVVPCTTLDRTTAAGNVHERSLMDIWTQGFEELRSWRPEGRCRTCDYAPACRGGCWLQRRKGTQCFKPAWEVPGLLKTAAGVALCLGTLACAQPAQAGESASEYEKRAARKYEQSMRRETGDGLELAVMSLMVRKQWARSGIAPERWSAVRPVLVDDALRNDPAGVFLEQYRQDRLPWTLEGLCLAVGKALETRQRSLAFGALLWRTLMEACLHGKTAAERSPAEWKALAETLASLEKALTAWRLEIFDKRLDPFLARGRKPIRYSFFQSKAGPRRLPFWLDFVGGTTAERWGREQGTRGMMEEATVGYLDRHPIGGELLLTVEIPKESSLVFLDAEGERRVEGKATIDIFDVLRNPRAGEAAAFTLRQKGGPACSVSMPGGREWTYMDLLVAACHQNGEAMDRRAEDALKKAGRWHDWPSFLWPPVARRLLKKLEAEDKLDASATKDEARKAAARQRERERRRWRIFAALADFWMF